MSKLKETLDTQQKINEAVKRIIDYFDTPTYMEDLKLMLNAQTQIMGLMELAKARMITTRGDDELDFQTDEITMFLRVVHEYLKMLEPFAELGDKCD